MKNRKLGIIGGSGIYDIQGLENIKWKKVKSSWGNPSDSILSASLKSPFWRIWTFPIKDGVGRSAGKITKKWSGLLKEAFTDADTFAVDFEDYPWNKEQKPLLLATAISIDFDYFEENSGNGGGIFDIFGD